MPRPKRRHVIASRRAELALGFAALAAAGVLLSDAYDRRGHDQPWWLRPLSFW